MSRRITWLALFALMPLPGLAQEKQNPFGSIQGLKLLKPADAQDVAPVSPPPEALVLFDGKNLDHWTSGDGKAPARWKLLDGGAMQVQGGNIITKESFAGKLKLHLEFRVPYQPSASGQGRGNSGVYLQGRYEVQILDSYGIPAAKLQQGDCGGIYTVARATVNACKAPTVWQSYDITFQAPTCAAGKVTEPAIMSVLQNGTLIQDKVRLVRKKGGQEEIVTNTTAGRGGDPCTPGPIMLQDHGNPVQYRNIWLVRVKD
jgi:hypothetical protein